MCRKSLMAADPKSASCANALAELLSVEADAATWAHFEATALVHVPGTSGIGGLYQGSEAIAGLARRLRHVTEGTLQFRPTARLTDDGGIVIVWGRTTARRGNRRLETGTSHVGLLRCGRIREAWLLYEDQRQFDEFWS